jgi:AcrR family transcriptional regulator
MAEEARHSPAHSAGASRGSADGGARRRILEAAYELLSQHGVHAVGIERIIAEAGVAKASFYHHFRSKEALIIAFLGLREERWTHGWLQAEAERLASTPAERAIAVFDALDEWFHRAEFEGCSFINTLLEVSDRTSPVHIETVRHLANVRKLLQGYAEQAGALDPAKLGTQLQTLLMGAIVSAGRGDADAARRIRPLVAATIASSTAAGAA